jgi:hypothetical protein
VNQILYSQVMNTPFFVYPVTMWSESYRNNLGAIKTNTRYIQNRRHEEAVWRKVWWNVNKTSCILFVNTFLGNDALVELIVEQQSDDCNSDCSHASSEKKKTLVTSLRALKICSFKISVRYRSVNDESAKHTLILYTAHKHKNKLVPRRLEPSGI